AKQAITYGFANLNINVNLTTDVWFAPHGMPGSYICVIAHWIEPGTWQMMKQVIAFEDFPVPHTDSALARTLIKTLVNFNLKNKIMSITLDNASNNTSAIGKLKLKYEPPMDGRFYHSRCVAHIINLVMQDGLAVPAINEIKESFKTMLKDVFKSSARTHQRYIKICSEAEKPCLSPNWDIPIRWNSTYHMFLCGLKQRSTLMYFHDLLASKGKCHHFPAENWVTIESINQLLEMFNNATKIYPHFQQDHLDAQERKQHKSGLENPIEFEEEILDAEVQQNKVIPLSEKEIAIDVASSEGTMSGSGSGSGGKEVDYDMTNYGYDDYE
nr:zinc finger BED domain-containing protein RICESLEEPER 2-like [Tanacetum cinerariifolium]